VTLVNAGHPSPLLYHRATRTAEEAIGNEAAGLPIGVLDGFEYASRQVSLEPGDCILAFTDGVTEAMDANDVQLQTKGCTPPCGAKPILPSARGAAGQDRQAVRRRPRPERRHCDGGLREDGLGCYWQSV